MIGAYDYLKKYVPGGGGVNANWFWSLSLSEIESSEKQMGQEFPCQLRQFYLEIGYGMLRSPHIVPVGYNFYSNNEILPPRIAVDYMQGIIEHPDEDDYFMAESTYEDLQPGDLPFFEIGDSSSYMVMKLNSDNPNAVWSDCGVKIEDSFERFIYRLYYESPSYYGSIIEDYWAKK